MALVEGNTKEEDNAKVVHNTKLVTNIEVLDTTLVNRARWEIKNQN